MVSIVLICELTPWLVEPADSILQSLQLTNNPYPEAIQFLILTPTFLRSVTILSSHLHLGLSRGLFTADLAVKILKELLHS